MEKEVLALLRVLEIFFHHGGHPPPQSLDKIIGIGMVSEICRLAGALKKLGRYLVSVDLGDREL